MAVGNSYFRQLVLSWGTHQIFFVPQQTAKMVLSPPGSPFTAHANWSLLSFPALTLTINLTIPKSACSGVTWSKTTLHPWTTGDSASASQHISHSSKPIFRCQSLLLGKKSLNCYKEWPAIPPGLDHSQRKPEALTWLDCAATLGKGFVYPHTSCPSRVLHTTQASGNRLQISRWWGGNKISTGWVNVNTCLPAWH